MLFATVKTDFLKVSWMTELFIALGQCNIKMSSLIWETVIDFCSNIHETTVLVRNE